MSGGLTKFKVTLTTVVKGVDLANAIYQLKYINLQKNGYEIIKGEIDE